MARPRSSKVSDVKATLIARLRDGLHQSGDRFMSNRAIARQFGISYQTADRLLRELCAEGLLVRRPAAGTFLPGGTPTRVGVRLFMHERGRRKQSFGSRLLAAVTERLDRERIDWKICWVDPNVDASKLPLSDQWFAVIWECASALEACVQRRRWALLLNQRPPAGIDSVFIDSVSTDDFSGGVCAAQLLSRRSPKGPFAVLSGPACDERSNERVAGFHSVIPDAAVVASDDWYFEGGLRMAPEVVRRGGGGIFCCNDRLAEAVIAWSRRAPSPLPPLVGFDDAPVAVKLDLTTIAIPWDELVDGAVSVIKRRLGGDTSTASRQIFAPRPVVRRL